MAGMQIKSNVADLRAAFANYTRYNRKENEVLWQEQSGKLAVGLFQAAKAVAPTREEIAADVVALGWHLPKYFHDGGTRGWRTERGKTELWSGATAKLNRRDARIRRRGRPRKTDALSPEEFLAGVLAQNKPTLEQMERFVIANRVKASGFIASAYLPACACFGGRVSASGATVPDSRGSVTIQRRDGLVIVAFINTTPGVLIVDDKHHFAAKAIADRAADVREYTARKQREILASFKP